MREETIRAFIVAELAPAAARLRPEDPLFESALDSTSVLALVAFLEKRFGIEIRDSEVVPANFASLRQIADFIAAKQAEQPRLAANG